MNKEDIRELAEDNAIYEFNKFKKIYGNYTDEYVRHFYNKLAELRGGIDDVHTCNCQHDSNSRDNEPCYKYDSRTAKINKAKVNSLEIIVRMVGDKPYYELKYREVGKEYYSVGYSSYDLKTVLDYIDTYFEIVEKNNKEPSPCSGCKYEKSTNIKELLAFCTHCKRAYSHEEDREIHEDRYEVEESEG